MCSPSRLQCWVRKILFTTGLKAGPGALSSVDPKRSATAPRIWEEDALGRFGYACYSIDPAYFDRANRSGLFPLKGYLLQNPAVGDWSAPRGVTANME